MTNSDNSDDALISLKDLEDETALSLVVLADTASEQLWRFFEDHNKAPEITAWHRSDELLDAIAHRARSVYTHNESFRKQWQKPDPREHARMFVQHWVASNFAQTFPSLRDLVPSSFYVGQSLPDALPDVTSDRMEPKP